MCIIKIISFFFIIVEKLFFLILFITNSILAFYGISIYINVLNTHKLQFNMKKVYSILILLIVISTGCIRITTVPKEFVCPRIEQNCFPATWTGTPTDTSSRYRDTARSYYIFEAVKQVNSSEDEWSICYITEKKAAITFTDQSLNRTMIYRMIRDNEGALESGIGAPLDGHLGAFSVRGTNLAFSATPAEGFYNIGNSDIYIATIKGYMVMDAVSLADSLDKNGFTWDAQPALSPDGNVIFYASDRPGIGGTDIWFTFKMPNGKWSSPINCGNVLNSKCDELTPFITQDGKRLLFSSCGHETIGGYDIFTSQISDDFWKAVKAADFTTLLYGKNLFSKPVNMKPPLNTPSDELFPSSPGNEDEILYYSSNQASKTSSVVLLSGGFDLYLRTKKVRAIAKEQKASEAKAQDLNVTDNLALESTNMPDLSSLTLPTFKLEGVARNARTQEPIPNAEISVREIPNPQFPQKYATKIMNDTKRYSVKEIEKDREFEITDLNRDMMGERFRLLKVGNDTLIIVNADLKGHYSVELERDREYEVTAQAPDLFFDSYKIRVDKNDTSKQIKNFNIPEELTLRLNFPTDVFKNPYKFTLDSNGIETNKTWQEEIDLLTQNLLLSLDKIEKIILVGHTDDVGSVEYNNKLGKNRGLFVVAELVKRGVPETLLSAESAGELQPLDKREGESLELDRKRLRRVELQKVLKGR